MSPAGSPNWKQMHGSAVSAPQRLRTRCCDPEIAARTGKSGGWGATRRLSTPSVASSGPANAPSHSISTLLADGGQLFDAGKQPVEHPLEIPADRMGESARSPHCKHG